MGAQTEIAECIVQGGANYVLPVKENQPALHKDLVSTFAAASAPPSRNVDDPPRPEVQRFEERDKGHGRLEKRTIALCTDLSWMMTAERWCGLSFLAMVTRERTDLATGKTSTSTSYYIGSDENLGAQEVARLIRRHWSIENELHWVLDMAFREDEARHRARHLAQNFATLRHFALHLLKGDSTRKVGVETSRRRAGWDRGYLLSLLSSAPGPPA
jgi:predicted transposase YbfD/YdcC